MAPSSSSTIASLLSLLLHSSWESRWNVLNLDETVGVIMCLFVKLILCVIYNININGLKNGCCIFVWKIIAFIIFIEVEWSSVLVSESHLISFWRPFHAQVRQAQKKVEARSLERETLRWGKTFLRQRDRIQLNVKGMI
ncbi:hypothetical protein SAY87_020750 [Trapa incisa]|uniref:Uncharacterized protein n=1 Tax=Trapa incisa TaxID=236973 RepID=A0AAN7PN57_9MYRT|nr:hypothetical protein SAY87_020750 [Trapa incisa]